MKPVKKIESEVCYLCGISSSTLYKLKLKYDIDYTVSYEKLNKEDEEENEEHKNNYKISDCFKPDIKNLISEFGEKGLPITSNIIREWLLTKKNLKVSKASV